MSIARPSPQAPLSGLQSRLETDIVVAQMNTLTTQNYSCVHPKSALVALLTAVAGGVGGVAADEPAEPRVRVERAIDAATSAALVQPDPLRPVLRPYLDLRDHLDEAYNLSFEAGFTLIFQQATHTDAGSDHQATGSYDLVLEWNVFDDDTLGSGTLGMLTEGGLVIGAGDGQDLSANIGSASIE